MRKILVVGILLLFLGASVVSGFHSNSPSSTSVLNRGWLYVGGSGPGNYTRIQDAIDNASDGDTVFVYHGTYDEYLPNPDQGVVVIGKSITLIGEDTETTIIDVQPDIPEIYGIVIKSYTNNVKISGFTIHGNYQIQSFGILTQTIGGDNHSIENCRVGSFGMGGILLDQTTNCLISDCQVYDTLQWGGICLLGGGDHLITRCSIFDHYNGIYIQQSTSCQVHHNNLYNNTINAYDTGLNDWNLSEPGEGNFYDDYPGEDTDNNGIGDTPYNISGGHNQDMYPLMQFFAPYSLLNISLDTHVVDERKTFNVTIKTLGGTFVSNATILFDDVITTTDNNGIVVLTAPEVPEDTSFQLVASKPGYTSDTDTIVIKNVEPVRAFFFGRITNLLNQEDYITFDAVKTRVMTFSPFSFKTYGSSEEFRILKDYRGWMGPRYIFARCDILL